ncbi:MAG: hypothetical protein KIS95_08185 [Anaerolineae bacterium]|uniref:hypothetical protein n=1 Tax=Promineifilum sp. TaxID=2664178 RepID=UPI001DE78F8E|nr:hypothetical protein [Anaerolineales bacterium]MCB8934748.1 hypothetical protein [Promineifilum sp.]MCO5181520.1 hypothetical protein [Promineifilum sp.]MCW5847191.1 hypothetical protein [Anaerolineae bacterium]
MNLLLYAEARHTLARQRGETPRTDRAPLFQDMAAGLPDEIFEELGYFGALDEEEAAEIDLDDSFDVLFRHHAADLAPA